MDKTRITNANKQHARRSAGAGEIIGRDTMNDLISRQAAIEACYQEHDASYSTLEAKGAAWRCAVNIKNLPSVQPEIIRCNDCKHNPKYEWFGCPMSHLNEKQRPETAWCWKAERSEVTE